VVLPLVCRCPKCQSPGNFLVVMSYLASVDYYRCDACLQAWFVPKGTCEPAEDVTLTRRFPEMSDERIH
jgi:hypothetical protein